MYVAALGSRAQFSRLSSGARAELLCSMWSLPGPGIEPVSPAIWETWVQILGGEDPLEKGMATHSSILA